MLGLGVLIGIAIGFFLRGWIQENLGLFKSSGKQKDIDPDAPVDGVPVKIVKWGGGKLVELVFGKPGKKPDEDDKKGGN